MAKRGSKVKRSSGPPPYTGDERIVALVGDEPFLMTDYTRRLRDKVADTVDAEVETLNFDGKKADLAEVLDELRSVGLMMQHKIVVVDEAEEFVKRYRPEMERYAAKPEPTATLLFRATKWYTGKLDKAIKKVGLLHHCADPTPAQARSWVVGRAKDEHGFALDKAAAALLVQRIGADLGRLDGELAKLSAAVPSGQTADAQVVAAIVGRASDDDEMWPRVQDAMLSESPRDGLEEIYELIELARVSPVPVMRAASDLTMKLAHAAQMLAARRSDFEVCKALKIWSQSRQRPFIAAARRLGVARATRLADRAVAFDRRSKSSFGDARRGVEQICVLLRG